MLKALIIAGFLALLTFAQDDLASAPPALSLQITRGELGDSCRRVDKLDSAQFAPISLHRIFNDDFDEHPLKSGRWVPHYAGGAAWPEANYWGGNGSQLKRQTEPNGEQQFYVDLRYAGRGSTPLGLDPFRVRNGVLSIVASRTPPELKSVLFDNPYVSGILTTQASFSQIRILRDPLKNTCRHRRVARVLDARQRRRLAAGNRRAGGTRDAPRGHGDDDTLADSLDSEDRTLRLRLLLPDAFAEFHDYGRRTGWSISSTASRYPTSRSPLVSTIRCT
jgi:hypothetical protein